MPLPTIKVTDQFSEALQKRQQKYLRYNNSHYWKEYYQPKKRAQSFSREATYAQIIKRYAPGDKVIDIGSGFGFLAKELWKQGLQVEAIDLFDEMLKEAKKYLADTDVYLHKQDILDLPPRQKYDAIVLMSVIEHFPYQEAIEDILPLMYKHLNPDGVFFVHVPVKSLHSRFARWLRVHINHDLPPWAIDDDGDITHKFWHSTDQYIQDIEAAGFTLLNVDHQLIRSNHKPKQLFHIMNFANTLLQFSDTNFKTRLEKETKYIKLIKAIKTHLALTSYMVFKKIE